MTLERVEKALFNCLCMSYGTTLWDYYRDAFIWLKEFRDANDETTWKKGNSLGERSPEAEKVF